MSNLSVAEVVAEIKAKLQLQKTARDETIASQKYGFHAGMVAGCEFVLGLLSRVKEPDRPLTLETAHNSPDYQFFLGLFADAVGATGSPDLHTVLEKARRGRDAQR